MAQFDGMPRGRIPSTNKSTPRELAKAYDPNRVEDEIYRRFEDFRRFSEFELIEPLVTAG